MKIYKIIKLTDSVSLATMNVWQKWRLQVESGEPTQQNN